ncbi:CorA family divalent cation transporter [Agathobaculum sp. NTUH-O15-33]|uniref:CorA family divalent cation transporter n=1 Tax=Agathobaculum sp. NTUH-O15-33 TaxID=3079302 RepID=UPI0029584558|nr:CorA family divalent cation transporter [Agathobaculum sp. NTUH-O15-33]WNX83734.1 CorA family divalent cation transporter [Agathobaculum sp. NTUH-O15-33]
MVEFYKTIDGRVTELSAFEEGCWVNMVRPSSDEIDMISGAAGVEEEFVRAALDPEESSRVEVEEDQLLMIIDVPMVEKNSVEGGQQMFSTLPMGIVVGGAAVITVCLEDSVILRSIAEGAVKGVHTSMRTRFVFQILLRVAGRFLKNLRMIERDFTKIEKRLYDSLPERGADPAAWSVQIAGLFLGFPKGQRSNDGKGAARPGAQAL